MRDEALLIQAMGFSESPGAIDGTEGDSSDAKASCTFSFHSAFEDPATSPDAPDRWSIEVRCMALYD
jgi:hypothetical protein